MRKLAEDRINPARIRAGKADPFSGMDIHRPGMCLALRVLMSLSGLRRSASAIRLTAICVGTCLTSAGATTSIAI